MTIKVLICDPDISFALPVKRALEQSGNYVVDVFANGQAAVDLIQNDPHEVAILDFNVDDMPLAKLIGALREKQPDIFILVSPRTDAHINELPSLDIQGSITKPYYARQLGPVIREAVAAKNRPSKKTPPPRAPEQKPTPPVTQIVEPLVEPDDTFHRLTQGIHLTETGPMQAVLPPVEGPTIIEPEIPEDATIRDLVSGQAAVPNTAPPPDTLPEMEHVSDVPPYDPAATDTDPEIELVPDLAVMALAVASDDTMPLYQLSLRPFLASVERNEKPSSKPLPQWVQHAADDPDQSTIPGTPMDVPGDTHPSRPFSPSDIQTPRPPSIDTSADRTQHISQRPPETSGMANVPTEPPSPPNPKVESKAVPSEPESMSAPTPESSAPSSEPVAALAIQLTQLTVESSAQVTLLTRDGVLVASAGDLSSGTLANVVTMINNLWQDSEGQGSGNSLIRYLQLPEVKDFLLFSIHTVDGMILSMLFPSEMPVRIIRQQAVKLRKALASIPEAEAESSPESSEAAPVEVTESEAATTSPSRPTDPHPPEGLRDQLRVKWTETVEAAVVAAPPPGRKDGPYAPYTFVWLPRNTGIEPEIAEMLLHWLTEIAAEHSWEIEGTEIQIPFVSVQVSTPADESPTTTIEILMRDTIAKSFNRIQWADAYYIVAPGRPITQQEINNFIDYQRETLRTTPPIN